MKRPMCTSILSGRSYVIKVLEGNPKCVTTYSTWNTPFLGTLCNELKRLHLLEEDTSIVSVEEAVGTVLFIFRHALRAALGCLIIRPNADVAEFPHSLRGNEKYYPWFEFSLQSICKETSRNLAKQAKHTCNLAYFPILEQDILFGY
ncbi:hypothetical protein CFP56_023908 [Quercus suber]|uniref:DUF8040 domain-containing protein n=1 Tax=Quercus suber TaxID=58331 RepID=A0AAW0K775_QUESU